MVVVAVVVVVVVSWVVDGVVVIVCVVLDPEMYKFLSKKVQKEKYKKSSLVG